MDKEEQRPGVPRAHAGFTFVASTGFHCPFTPPLHRLVDQVTLVEFSENTAYVRSGVIKTNLSEGHNPPMLQHLSQFKLRFLIEISDTLGVTPDCCPYEIIFQYRLKQRPCTVHQHYQTMTLPSYYTAV